MTKSDTGTPAALGLGANLGAPLLNLQHALAALAAGGFRHQRVSPVYLTPPVDCVPGTPDFYNAAVTGLWDGTPEELRALCHAVEQTLGRPAAHAQDEARALDLDLLLFGTLRLPPPARRGGPRRFTVTPPRRHTAMRFPLADPAPAPARTRLCASAVE